MSEDDLDKAWIGGVRGGGLRASRMMTMERQGRWMGEGGVGVGGWGGRRG